MEETANKEKSAITITEEAEDAGQTVQLPENQSQTRNFIRHTAPDLKPEGLKMRQSKWKVLVRSILKGKNVLFTGHSGCGKTIAAMSAVRALNRKFFYFNLGATQRPRTSLIGTREVRDGSTYFSPSVFVEAIQTENAVILLDELSRAHPEAANILLTPLDPKQRYLRLDEHEEKDTVKVADSVSFVGTANIGNEYTAARRVDRAMWDRFTVIEMDLLGRDEEKDLILETYPSLSEKIAGKLARIAEQTRDEAESASPQIETIISTRQNLEAAEMIRDGLSLEEAAQVAYYPNYESEGGVEAPRNYVKKVVQREIDDDSDEELFSSHEIEDAPRRNN